MPRYRLLLEYDGSGFAGWQFQPGIRTIQGEIERALFVFVKEEVRVCAAGRTDAGVHAAGQVVTFELDWAHSTEQLGRALNANLPHDVSVKSVETVDVDFHPRFSARARTYQ